MSDMSTPRRIATLGLLLATMGTSALAAGASGGVYSVLDYGAKGDGVTDDSAAFQKAVQAAAKVGGYATVPPVGKGKGYVLTHTVHLPLGASLLGSPAGFSNNAWAAFDLPEQHVVGVKILARPAPGEYQDAAKKPLFLLDGGNTVRGLWIMYDEQPWPTDQEFNDPKSPYHYDSFDKAKLSFIKDHVRPYGPTFYFPGGGANVVIEDIVCDRYYDFFFQVRGGKTAIDRIYLYGYKRGFVIKESADVNRLSNIHLCPNTGPACPGTVGSGKKYSWIYGIVASQPDCIGVQLGKSDGYCISNSFFLGVHTGVRFGASPAYPLWDPVANIQCFYDPEKRNLSGFASSYDASGPWGYISTLGVDGCVIGFHFVWPTTMTTCMLTNAYVSTVLDDGQDFPAVASTGGQPIARQGAFVVEPSYCAANSIGITPTFMCSNAQISSFKPTGSYGPAAANAADCNGRVFLINGDITMDFSNLQINSPYKADLLNATGPSAKHWAVRIRGFIQTGQPSPDVTLKNRDGALF